ncbi:Gfo/Idh/MocA family oxidoreductase, partial [Acinetobacter baumannii]
GMNKLRVGVIGLGSWGMCHLEAFRCLPQVEIVAVCDNRPERQELAEQRFPQAAVYASYEELLSRDDLDLVSVVTYEKEHLAPTLAALASGKHV